MIISERQEKWKGYKGIDSTAQNFSSMKQQLQIEESRFGGEWFLSLS